MALLGERPRTGGGAGVLLAGSWGGWVPGGEGVGRMGCSAGKAGERRGGVERMVADGLDRGGVLCSELSGSLSRLELNEGCLVGG
jgi:hypothetical protein